MRILVVEDNAEKLRQVLAAIARGGCTEGSVDVAYDIRQAKLQLREHHYDLMVLDFVIPQHPSEEPKQDGGIKLLREIEERDGYKTPREVVGLTAYFPVDDAAADMFSQYTWTILTYDPTSDLWSTQLSRKVSHLLVAEGGEEALGFNCFACVITALSKETEAVLRLPWKWQEFKRPNDVSMYWKGEAATRNRTNTVYAATAPRMGITATAILATKMIEAFRPQIVVMTGIAAGMRGECEIGDIVAADPTWNWESGKYSVVDGTPVFLPAPHQLPMNSAVRVNVERLGKDVGLFDSLRREWRGHAPGATPRLLVGPVASGGSVLADRARVSAVESQHRKVLGIEMESYGLYSASSEARVPQPLAISLKGISDFADEAKTDDFQQYAAYLSAETMRALLERYF